MLRQVSLVLFVLTAFFIAGFAQSENLAENSLNAPLNEKTPTEPQAQVFITSPEESQTLTDSTVVVALIEGLKDVNKVWLEVNDTQFGGVFSENVFTADLPLDGLENGSYVLSVFACNTENSECVSSSVNILIEKPEEILEAVVEEPETVLITPSNVSAALSFVDADGNVIASGSEALEAPKGVFDARVSFFGRTVQEIQLNSVTLDSNATLIELSEEINFFELTPPEKNTEWLAVAAVKANALFDSGQVSLAAPQDAESLYECSGWDFNSGECGSGWMQIPETIGQKTVVSFTGSGAFGFAKQKAIAQKPEPVSPQKIVFDRSLDCHKCGKHKAPPLARVDVTVYATPKNPVQETVLFDLVPVEWGITDTQGGSVSDFNSDYRKISWDLSDFNSTVSRSYTVASPQRTTPSTKYFFSSSVDGVNSKEWLVVVADPDVNMTVTACSGGTINSCSGMNTLGSSQDIVLAKNETTQLTMSNESYSNSVNTVKVYVNHSGASGIGGTLGITMWDEVNGVEFCSEDTSITNTSVWMFDVITACTPTGGWDSTKLDNLEVRVKNLTPAKPTNAYLDYLTVEVSYTAVSNDYSFVLNLPSSGCTQGKGSTDAVADCERGYFEPTDLVGQSDDQNIHAEGQTPTKAFLVYDNQSTTSSDLNITIDLNAALPATLALKASLDYYGWASSCSDNAAVDCVLITAAAKNIGTAAYSTGTDDLNVFLFADFVAAWPSDSTTRDINSVSIAP